MAIPIHLLIGAALLAGGTYAQNQAVRRQQQATNSAVNAALQGQMRDHNRFDERRQELVGQALTDSRTGREATDDAMAERAAQLQQQMQENRQRPESAAGALESSALESGGGQPAGYRVFQNELDSRMQDVDAEGDTRTQALGNLASLGDVFAANHRSRMPIMAHMDMENSFARDRANQLQLEMQAAREKGAGKGQNTMALGSLMSAGGMAMLGNAGMSAAGGAAAGGSGGVTLGGATSQTLNAARAAQAAPGLNPYMIGTGTALSRY
jgi:hypothetical protein